MFVVTLPDLADLGFDLFTVNMYGMRKRKRTQSCYEIYWRLTMVHDAGDTRLCWELARQGTQPYDSKNGARMQLTTPLINSTAEGKECKTVAEMVGYQLYETSNTSHHPFVRTVV